MRFVVCVALAASAAADVARADLLGIAWRDGTYMRIDEKNGAATVITTLGPPGTSNSLAMNAHGHLYTTRNIEKIETLLRLDPATGAVLAQVPLPLQSVRELAFAPNGTLYALNIPKPKFRTELWTINPATGESTLVGASESLEGVQGMAFSPQGILYGWSVWGFGLMQIDPQTGEATPLFGSGIKGIQAIAFGPGGVLYGAEHEVYTINLTNGEATLVAPITLPQPGPTIEELSGLRGLVWVPAVGGCYPDCNSDGILNLADFGCFQTKFALSDPYADCNRDGLRNLSDFGCFQTRFALGCP